MTINCPRCHSANFPDSQLCSKCGTRFIAQDEMTLSIVTLPPQLEDIGAGAILKDRYRIMEKVAHGGMGVVYRAEDIRLKRTVAVKFLSMVLTGESEARERFVHEAQAASELDHPNVCTIHEFDETEAGQMYIVMTYYKGESLKNKIERGLLEIEEALDITIQMARGLEKAHEHGIVHRDVKPANILITEDGLVKIVDFGLAKLAGTNRVTKAGSTMGTVVYMSPEQAQGHEVNHLTDIWSLGVVLYEMLSGELPFKGDREISILYSIVHQEPKHLRSLKAEVPQELERIVRRALGKQSESRYSSAREMLADLVDYQSALQTPAAPPSRLGKLFQLLMKPQMAIPGIVVISVLCFFLGRWYYRRAKIDWAKNKAIPQIRQLSDEFSSNFNDQQLLAAYHLAEQTEKYIPGDPGLDQLWKKVGQIVTIETSPSGAKVYMKFYVETGPDWMYLGTTPLERVRVPNDILLWRLEKEGYEPVIGVGVNEKLVRSLDKAGNVPAGMVRVTGRKIDEKIGQLDDFFIDRYETTNRQFKEFVDAGGYRKKDYWKQKFVKDGKELSWDETMAAFVDSTGRPGPSTWQAGDYPKGQENYPVSGISWYEAAAYAESAGKSLPTVYHWAQTAGFDIEASREKLPSRMIPLSNFGGAGPVAVGSNQGIGVFGAYDMAGNVREWCWNESKIGRYLRGGAWNDIKYMYQYESQAPAFDRSPKNGFRCIRYMEESKILKAALEPIGSADIPNYYEEKPVTDAIFQVYKELFSYDKTNLDARVEWRNESSKDWIQEKITFDAAYDNERVIAYLFLPRRNPAPYQTVIYFPGGSAFGQKSSKDLDKYFEFEDWLSFIVKNGRAVLFPVYKGTFERGIDSWPSRGSHQSTELTIKAVKDFKRSIDYLETRSDIDSQRFAYYGLSRGGCMGAYVPAVEDRLKASILLIGGLWAARRPEANPINFVTRVKIPTLMMNGRYDMIFPYEISAKPMFDLLGTPKEQKEQKLYSTDHDVPKNELIKETLIWLDRYLGPVR